MRGGSIEGRCHILGAGGEGERGGVAGWGAGEGGCGRWDDDEGNYR